MGEFVLKLRLRRAPDSWVFKGRSFEESAFLYSEAVYRPSCRSSVLEGNISTEVIDAEKGLLWGGVSSTKWRLPHKSGRVTTKRSFYANKKLLRGNRCSDNTGKLQQSSRQFLMFYFIDLYHSTKQKQCKSGNKIDMIKTLVEWNGLLSNEEN